MLILPLHCHCCTVACLPLLCCWHRSSDLLCWGFCKHSIHGYIANMHWQFMLCSCRLWHSVQFPATGLPCWDLHVHSVFSDMALNQCACYVVPHLSSFTHLLAYASSNIAPFVYAYRWCLLSTHWCTLRWASSLSLYTALAFRWDLTSSHTSSHLMSQLTARHSLPNRQIVCVVLSGKDHNGRSDRRAMGTFMSI